MRSLSLKSLGLFAAVSAATHVGCSDPTPQEPQGNGGSSASSTTSSTTNPSSGGSSTTSGNKTSTGGAAPASGGSVASNGGATGSDVKPTGGSTATSSAVVGGSSSTGSAAGGAGPVGGKSGGAGRSSGNGGGPAAGGKSGAGGGGTTPAAGGVPVTGGRSGGVGGANVAGAGNSTTSVPNAGQGGTPVGGDWGKVEDPGASCTVGAIPAFSSLKANSKLPDPFTKMDGTAITSKKDWMCRREEILQEGYAFIYGKKPRTPASAVSGTVSSSNISVTVNDGGTATIKATVSVPTTGKAPYPALITYSSVASDVTTQMKNNGVAVINYDPYSVGSESAVGTGAFYSVYGKSNEAGLLVAWAWGVSRIIDAIEKNPGTIDPTKIAVTGCSRFGKGAFVAGVLDNRVALTIPMESGIGGTPALRLIEQLDSYSGSEWPYHAISYEPWFSTTLLGQFTNGNSASGDNTDKLPVDMHEMMALIVPRGLYIVDNPSTNYNGLDRNSAYATAMIGAKLFEALGVKDNFTYQGASGSHCQWRTQYTDPLVANIKKFLLGDATAKTGTFATDLGGTKPTPDSYMGFTIPTLSGEL